MSTELAPMPRILAPPTPSAEWAYFLDFDGTLVELADHPDDARADTLVRDILTLLRHATGGAVALVSGRTIRDLRRQFGYRALAMAGQHGTERLTAKGRRRSPGVPRTALDAARVSMRQLIEAHPGLLLEDKGHSLALHYRQLPALGDLARDAMQAALAQIDDRFTVTQGKCVVELHLRGRDKGVAIAEFMTEAPFIDRRPVFIGDDWSDEAGFATINALGGVSVKVGTGDTIARWRLPNVDAVHDWLRQVDAC